MTRLHFVTVVLAAAHVSAVLTAAGQTAATTSASCSPERPRPYPVPETQSFARAVERRTRTRTGSPGPAYWQQRAAYRIDAHLDPAAKRLTGRETVRYTNFSPDTLARLAVYLRQNIFLPGAPRNIAVPVTAGLQLQHVAVAGQVLAPTSGAGDASASVGSPGTIIPGYAIDGTVAWLTLPTPLPPRGGTVEVTLEWAFTVPPPPADGRQGEDGSVFFLGYWYPQLAVYDDVSGWVTDPYLGTAEFYMGYADYDVWLTAPAGWLVAGTGVLRNADDVLSPGARARLAQARRSNEVVHVVGRDDRGAAATGRGRDGQLTWHYSAATVRDFAWGASADYLWDATRAIVGDHGRDTVDIYSLYRPIPAASAWVHSARYTRNAVEFLSRYLWAYPYRQMTAVEGVIEDGMEYPALTLIGSYSDTLLILGTIMHETAHEWFPMQVGSNETRYVWQDEGLTQFNSAQGQREVYGVDRFTPVRADYLRLVRAGREVELMRPGDLWGDDDAYHTLAYKKTAMALVALQAMLGDSGFMRAYHEYGRRWQWKHPQPYDFFNTFNDVSRRDLSWFWRTWFYETWPLDQAIAAVRTVGDSMEVVIEDRGLAPMPVRLAITRADGTMQRLEVPVDVWLCGARRHVLRVPARPTVVRVEIDPEGVFPDVDRTNQIWPAPR